MGSRRATQTQKSLSKREREIMDLLAYLRLVANPSDDEASSRSFLRSNTAGSS